MEKLNSDNRIVYLDILRVIAICGVILIHVSAVGLTDKVGTQMFAVSLVYNSITRWAVPLFFMISGAVFLRPDKEYGFEIMIKRYILKILFPLLVWGGIYSLFDMYLYGNVTIKSIMVVAWNVFSNHSGYHLWYLYALFSLYLMVPVFRIIVSNTTKSQQIFIILSWMILSLGVSQFNYITDALSLPLTLDWYFPMLTSWAGYFFLGYFLHAHKINEKMNCFIIIEGCVILVLCSSCNVIISCIKGFKFDGFMPQNGLTACIGAIAVFLFVKQMCKKEIAGAMRKRIYLLVPNVFGVYLVHVLVNSFMFHICQFKLDILHPVIAIPFYGMIVLGISYCVVVLFRKNNLLRRIVS